MGRSCTGQPADHILARHTSASASLHHGYAHQVCPEPRQPCAEAAWHEKMAVSHGGRPKGDLPPMISHYRSLREQFTSATKEARALNVLHRVVPRMRLVPRQEIRTMVPAYGYLS